MADIPPPTQPPPGWYPDPSGDTEYRWWDGSAWTESVTVAGETGGSKLGSVRQWLRETFGLTVSRAGHLLPAALFFVLFISIVISVVTWLALRDTVLTFSPDDVLPAVDYGGSQPWLMAMVLLLPLSTVMSYFFKATVIRQAWAALEEEPEQWLDSLRHLRTRGPRILFASIRRSAVYWVLFGGFWAAVVFEPVFILLFPFVALALAFAWVRLCFVGTSAVIGPSSKGPFSASFELTGRGFAPLFGRLLLLAIVAANMILAASFLATPFAAIANQGATPIEPTAEVLRLNDLLGPNLAGFALTSLFNALGLSANYALSAVGTTLLYRRLNGPVDDSLVFEGEPEPAL